MTKRLARAVAVAPLLFALACSPESDAESDSAPVVGGEDARGSEWDAVGSLSDSEGSYCTGTLIAPRLVLSARHCVHGPSIWRGEITFNIGGDSRAPKRTVVPVSGSAGRSLAGS